MVFKELKKQAENLYDDSDYVTSEKKIRQFYAENIDKCSDADDYPEIRTSVEYINFKKR